MGAGVGGAGVVCGEDGEFHVIVEGGLVAFYEPDVAGAEHGVGGGEEVGAQGSEGREGRVYLVQEGFRNGGGIGALYKEKVVSSEACMGVR